MVTSGYPATTSQLQHLKQSTPTSTFLDIKKKMSTRIGRLQSLFEANCTTCSAVTVNNDTQIHSRTP